MDVERERFSMDMDTNGEPLIIGLRLLVLMIILLFDPSLGDNFICKN